MSVPPLLLKNLRKPRKKNGMYSQEAKVQAVSQYLVLGNMALVAAMTGIDHDLLRKWKMQTWWKEIETQIKATEQLQTDGKLSKIVDKSLDAVLDRVEKGEFVMDKVTGKLKRRPASLRDIARVSSEMITKRELLRGNATERKETTQVSVAEQLKELALEFARWQSPAKPQETIDVDAVEILEDIKDQDAIHEKREA